MEDELLVQLCNQTYNNTNQLNSKRTWDLMQMAVSVLCPTPPLLSMLQHYFQFHAPTVLISQTLLTSLSDGANARRGRAKTPTGLEQVNIAKQPGNIEAQDRNLS